MKKKNLNLSRGYFSQTKNVCKCTLTPANPIENPVKNIDITLLECENALNTPVEKSRIADKRINVLVFRLNEFEINSVRKEKKI